MDRHDVYRFLLKDEALDVSERTRLPGRLNGPMDAFRHLYLAARLTQKFGVLAAATVLAANETRGENRDGGKEMDEHNNWIGIGIGLRTRTADEARAASEEMISRSVPFDGAKADDRATWLHTVVERELEAGGHFNWPPRWDAGGSVDRTAWESRPLEETLLPQVLGSPIYLRDNSEDARLLRNRVRETYRRRYGDAVHDIVDVAAP